MSSTLKDAANFAQIVRDAAGRLHYNVSRGRVTHTRGTMRGILEYCAKVSKFLETDKQYAKRFEVAIMQAQDGPVEMGVSKDGQFITIAGVFRVDSLRDFLLVNEPSDVLTIPVLGPEPKQPKPKKWDGMWDIEENK